MTKHDFLGVVLLIVAVIGVLALVLFGVNEFVSLLENMMLEYCIR